MNPCSPQKERLLRGSKFSKCISQRLHVAIWYILRAQNGSHMTTLRPKYIPYNYMEPLGLAPCQGSVRTRKTPGFLALDALR